jgi:uncharacterized membrane protein YfcA
MTTALLAGLSAATLAVALLYSSVGQAGASGYIAVMALFGVAPSVIKPMALVLNTLVASLTTLQFHRAGHFSWGLFWPFAASATPLAFLGGYVNLPVGAFKVLVGLILLFSAGAFILGPARQGGRGRPSLAVSLLAGAGLGLLSGLTGTGGGIFLTPLLLLMGWAGAKEAAGVSAPFILCNSAAGLGGNIVSTNQLPAIALPLALAALVGGAVGSTVGSTRLPDRAIKRCLAIVLAIAGTKLILYG